MHKKLSTTLKPLFRIIRNSYLLCVLYIPSIYAQDTIVKRNQEKIIAKILEVNPDNVVYKRYDYQNGPTFTAAKWELNYIVYGNGVKESFEGFPLPSISGNLNPIKKDLYIQTTGKFYYYKSQKIMEEDMLDIAWKLNDKKINQMVNKTEQEKVIKNCFLLGGILVGTTGILTYTGVFSSYNNRINTSTVGKSRKMALRLAAEQRRKLGGYLLLGGIASELCSVTFKLQETKHAHIVVDAYNKSLVQ